MPPDFPNFHLKLKEFKKGDLVYIPQDTVFIKNAVDYIYYRTDKPSIGIVIDHLFTEDKHICDDLYDVYVIEANDIFMANRDAIYNLKKENIC